MDEDYSKLIERIIIKDNLIKEKVKEFNHKRFLFKDIKSGRPFKSILGLRGVGKTTLLAQLAIKEKGLYISLDDFSIKTINLLDLLRELNKRYDYKNFFLDEIQNLSKWDYYLKEIFELTKFNIVFTGSSLIDLVNKATDLSRRVSNNEIPPLSFREYILFKTKNEVPKITYEELLDAKKRKKKITEVAKYNDLMKEYMDSGAYPFIFESDDILSSFENILEKTFYQDFAKIKDIGQDTINKAYKILKYISSGTEEISFTKLSNDLDVSKNKIYSIFELLEKSQLVIKIEPKLLGRKLLRKHPKYNLLLPIRTLTNKINGVTSNIGNLREDFFITSMFKYLKEIRYIKTAYKQPDFFLKNTLFEIGGKNKSKKQIKGYDKGFIVTDSLISEDDKIPLILFGFLY